jgi:HlyD family secretion protein
MKTLEAPVQTRVTPVRRLPTPISPRRRLVWFLVGGIVALILTVVVLLPPKVSVVRLSTVTVRDEAAGTGFVRAKVTIGVGAKINGVVLKTYVDQGDAVRKGQLMAELQNQDLHSQVGQAASLAQAQQAALSSARANLSASKARQQASSSDLGKSQAGLRLAQINYGRAKSLYEGGVWSKEALDSAETTDTQAQEDVHNAQALQSSAQDQVKAAESEVIASEKMAAGSDAGVRLQRANLQYAIITSPVDGYVVSRDLEEGATVVPGLPIFTVAQSRVIWVSANIDEREIDGLKVGQPATITLRSAPSRKIPGLVARIAKEADPVTEEVVVDVAFPEQSSDLKLNETAEVYILKSEKAGAKALPITAIVSGRDGAMVWMIAQGKLQLHTVLLGTRDKRGLVEVLKGLSDSDEVMAQPNAAGVPLAQGKRVRTSLVKTATAGPR